jgi:acyl-CoA synthetase (AMP-forming)/AMP-acid ligase II
LEKKNFFVDSLKHPELENQVILIIEGERVLESEIKAACKKYLNFFEVPKRIFFLPKFLRSKNMKILKEKNKKLALSLEKEL